MKREELSGALHRRMEGVQVSPRLRRQTLAAAQGKEGRPIMKKKFSAALAAALIIAAIVWYLRHGDCNRWLAAGVTLIVAGGLGNLYDRLTLGYVIDFIEVLFVRFAIFNVADVAVVCGTVCLIIGILKTEGKAR